MKNTTKKKEIIFAALTHALFFPSLQFHFQVRIDCFSVCCVEYNSANVHNSIKDDRHNVSNKFNSWRQQHNEDDVVDDGYDDDDDVDNEMARERRTNEINLFYSNRQQPEKKLYLGKSNSPLLWNVYCNLNSEKKSFSISEAIIFCWLGFVALLGIWRMAVPNDTKV
jgi:hypothetical protein